jgi:YidC/Oxa1 family membrane protein insertase
MEKRFFLAMILSIAVFLTWSHFVSPPPPDVATPKPTVTDGSISADTPTPYTDSEIRDTSNNVELLDDDSFPEPTPKPEQRIIHVETSLVFAKLDTSGGRIISWRLKNYDGTGNEPIELISPLEPLSYPGDLRINGLDMFNNMIFATEFGSDTVVLDENQPELVITLTAALNTGEFLQKDFTFHHNKYMVNMDVTLANKSSSNLGSSIEYLVPDKLIEPLEGAATNRYFRSGPVFWDGHSRERPRIDKIQARTTYPGVKWAAYQENYFFAGIASTTQLATGFIEQGRTEPDSMKTETVVPGILLDSRSIAPGDAIMQRIVLLMGPKKYDELKELGLGIENIVDFGWITVLGKFFYYVLTTSVVYLKNFGLGIILITVAIKLILFPLSHKQMQSMKKMQAIQPQMKAIQEKYRKDPQKQQQELGKLYKTHGVNPMGGCLPLLVQFPVFIALYQVLMNAIEMRGASFLWVSDLSQPNVAMVIIMGVSMFVQQKMTPATGDPRQAKIMMMLPIIFTAMFWNFPAGLVLYWLTNNILTIGQQYVMNRLQNEDNDQEPKMKARVKRKLEEKNKLLQ